MKANTAKVSLAYQYPQQWKKTWVPLRQSLNKMIKT